MRKMLIGIDDTDSLKGMCTTYLAALLVEKLGTTNYPKLIRLNPNIPWKTRGNGAVSFEVEGNSDEIKEIVLNYVKKYSKLDDENTNPGVVFLEKLNKKNRKILAKFYKKTVSELVEIKETERIAELVGAEIHKFKNGRGIIGALAAIGAELSDNTYELISYRNQETYGKKRKIDENSVIEMDKKTYPETFDNIDPETGRILITPRGYDPIFSGIRGENPEILKKAWKITKPLEMIDGLQIFETNQGTDVHLRNRKISELRAYDCAILKGGVCREPYTIDGGHALFSISDSTGQIDCAAYRQTGNFRDIIRKLVVGDKVIVYGGLGKYPNTLNLEKIRILKLKKLFKKENPVCCSKRMTSAGRGKGFRCRKCDKRVGKDSSITNEIPRNIKLGFYEVPPRARRHLSMPLIRMTEGGI